MHVYYIYICVCVCVNLYICIWIYIYIYLSLSIAFSKSSAKQYIYIYIYSYIYMYVHTHTHIYIWILFWLVLMYSADTTTPGKERNKHNKLSNSKNWVHGNSLLFTPPPQILNLIPTQKGPQKWTNPISNHDVWRFDMKNETIFWFYGWPSSKWSKFTWKIIAVAIFWPKSLQILAKTLGHRTSSKKTVRFFPPGLMVTTLRNQIIHVAWCLNTQETIV